MKMKVIIIAAVLEASIVGSASATVDKCMNVTSPRNSHVTVFKYDETKVRGEIVVWRCRGGCDWEIDGLPPWLKQVRRTSVGYDLIGRPQAGTFNIKYKVGKGWVSSSVPPNPNWIGRPQNETWIFAPGYRIHGTCGPIPMNYRPW